MSDYFEEVGAGLRAAAERRLHRPWYRRIRPTRARALVLAFVIALGAGTALAATGTFDSASTVVSSTCETSAAPGAAAVAHPCVFVLGDGTRFSCPASFADTLQTADTLEHAAACSRLPSLAIPSAWQPVTRQIQSAGSCIAGNGYRVSGGPILGQPAQDEASPIGELHIENGNSPIVIGFYLNPRVAQSVADTARTAGHGPIDHRSNVVVGWTSTPSGDERSVLERCAFG